MPGLQIYSRRLWSAKNFAGALSLFNPGPDLYVIRTVTVYFGGITNCSFSLQDENGTGVLVDELGPLTHSYMIWPDIRLMWAPGTTWSCNTTFGADLSGHGYQLTPPT